jgi:solute carrier family 30 (zinc transporter), member 9
MFTKQDASTRAVLSAITSNFLVTIAKFIGWSISYSPSMLAETIHSLADVCNQFLLYVGIKHGSSQPTKMYPFGKGQARYIWNLVSAMGIFFVGFGVTTYHGISQLIAREHHDIDIHPLIPIAILIFALIAEGYTLWIAYNAVEELRGERTLSEYIRHGDDPTTVGVLLEDTIAVLGVIFALIGLGLSHLTGSHVPDAIASILIGCLLGVMAVTLAVANGRILMGVSAGGDLETEIREFVEMDETVERVTSLKTAVLAPGRLRLSLEVEFHGGILIDREIIERDAERIREGEDPAYILFETSERMVRLVGRTINQLEAKIHKEFPEVVLIDLEVN